MVQDVYGYFEYIDVIGDEIFHSVKLPKIIDAAYYMLCWCIEKGYVGKEIE
jgi:hypothetical protein